MKTGVSFCRLFNFLKIDHKIFNSGELVNFFLSDGGPSLAHSKNINCIGSVRILRGDGWKYRDIMGKMSIFPKAPLISLTFCA